MQNALILQILYYSDVHNAGFNPVGILNTSDDIVVKLIIGAMYFILPMFFIAAIGWTGIKLGDIAASFSNGSKQAQASGSQVAQRGTNIAQQTATKGMK